MLYATVKHCHITSVIVSFSLFWLKGLWVLSGHDLPKHPVLRAAPHAVDTVLLTSALWLTTLVGQYPFINGWLTMKVVGVVLYILLGWFALKRASTTRGRVLAFSAACLVFAFLVTVARTHHPAGILRIG